MFFVLINDAKKDKNSEDTENECLPQDINIKGQGRQHNRKAQV